MKEALDKISAEEKTHTLSEREDYILSLANSIGEISDKKSSWGKSCYESCVLKLQELHGESEESARIVQQTDIPWQKVQAETTLSDKESAEIRKEVFEIANNKEKLLQSKAV